MASKPCLAVLLIDLMLRAIDVRHFFPVDIEHVMETISQARERK